MSDRTSERRVWVFNKATRDAWDLVRSLLNEDSPPLPTLHHVLEAPRVQEVPALFMVTLEGQQWSEAVDLMEVARRVLMQGPLPAEDVAAWLKVLDHDLLALEAAEPADGLSAGISDLLRVTKDGPVLERLDVRPRRRWFGRRR